MIVLLIDTITIKLKFSLSDQTDGYIEGTHYHDVDFRA